MSECLTAKEAYDLIQDGTSIVNCAGYTFYKNGYFSYGTYPECIRSGSITLEGMMGVSNNWKVMTDYDIVMSCGYREHEYFYNPIREDGTGMFKALNKFLEENLTVEHYKDPLYNKKMVAKFFDEQCI